MTPNHHHTDRDATHCKQEQKKMTKFQAREKHEWRRKPLFFFLFSISFLLRDTIKNQNFLFFSFFVLGG